MKNLITIIGASIAIVGIVSIVALSLKSPSVMWGLVIVPWICLLAKCEDAPIENEHDDEDKP